MEAEAAAGAALGPRHCNRPHDYTTLTEPLIGGRPPVTLELSVVPRRAAAYAEALLFVYMHHVVCTLYRKGGLINENSVLFRFEIKLFFL